MAGLVESVLIVNGSFFILILGVVIKLTFR